MTLPENWINHIFEKLTLAYGVDFMNRWKGLSAAEVKTHWAQELGGFSSRKDAVSFALNHLPPGKPPTVLEFRELMRKAPPPKLPQLPDTPASREVIEAEKRRQDEIRRRSAPAGDQRDWARRLVAKADAGQWVRPSTLQAARDALRDRRVTETTE